MSPGVRKIGPFKAGLTRKVEEKQPRGEPKHQSRQERITLRASELMKSPCTLATLPFGAVVLATEQCHLLVVKEGHAAQGSLVGVVDVAANVFCWGNKTQNTH